MKIMANMDIINQKASGWPNIIQSKMGRIDLRINLSWLCLGRNRSRLLNLKEALFPLYLGFRKDTETNFNNMLYGGEGDNTV